MQRYNALWPIREEGFLDNSKFEGVFVGTMHRLNELLLSAGRHTSPENRRDPLARIFRAVRQYHHDGLGFVRDWEAFRLGLLASDLESLVKSHPNALRRLRRDYRRTTFNEYFGWRHEVRTAAMFAQHGISFQKTEAPDFELLAPFDGSTAECAAVNVAHSLQGKDLIYKLTNAILKKAAKPYASKSTILLVDHTNVLFTSVLNRRPLTQGEINDAVAPTFRRTSFGALLATALVADVKARRFLMGGFSEIASDAADGVRRVFEALDFSGPRDVAYTVPFTI